MIDPEIRLDVLGQLAESIQKDTVPENVETFRYDTLCYYFTLSVVIPMSKGLPVTIGPRNKLYRYFRQVGKLSLLEPFLEKKK